MKDKKTLHLLSGYFGFFSSNERGTNFNLFKWLKKSLISLGVPIHDVCCKADLENRPVRYNEVTSAMERLDSVTNTWIAI